MEYRQAAACVMQDLKALSHEGKLHVSSDPSGKTS